jgi:hypothetical protein
LKTSKNNFRKVAFIKAFELLFLIFSKLINYKNAFSVFKTRHASRAAEGGLALLHSQSRALRCANGICPLFKNPLGFLN